MSEDRIGELSHRLDGKIALVTGAGSSGEGFGTGKAIAVTLARSGARVLLVDNVIERAEQTLQIVRAEGGTAAVFEADISHPEQCEAMVAAARERFGGLDILVNNAAITKHVAITDTSPELYDSVVRVNLTGTFMACKFAVPALVARGGGSIVNIGSVASIRDSGSTHPAYSSTKAALLGLTVDLAGAYGRENVRVNAVLPGMIDTPMARAVVPTGHAAAAPPPTPNLLARRGDAWDIAHAVRFLCSDEGAYITGVSLPVDGGAVMAMPSSYILRSGAAH